MDDLKKCEFPAVLGLLDTVNAVNIAVGTERDNWLSKMNIASMDMLDDAGGAFSEVYSYLNQVTQASKEMQAALRVAALQATEANMATVKQCASNYSVA